MARWQQGINCGGFVGGMGTENENGGKGREIKGRVGVMGEKNEVGG